MLLELHVRNLALIESVDIEFSDGLNILTGETGAGKSILMGSVNLALGEKASREMIRSGAEYAYVELLFSIADAGKIAALKELDVTPDEDGILIISRKITPARSVSKVNDETVTAAKLRQITGLLLDIHGQHEHQSLLYHSRHLEILDLFGKAQIRNIKEDLAVVYKGYQSLSRELETASVDQDSRLREMDFLRFEIEEIEQADIRPGEEESLQILYRKYNNSKKIAKSLSMAYDAVTDHKVSHALKSMEEAAGYDEELNGIRDQFFDAEAILSDLQHEINAYMDHMSFDEETFYETEKRLDLIRTMESKYGSSEEAINENLKNKRKRLEFLENLDILKAELEQALDEKRKHLLILCAALSDCRKKAAKELTRRIKKGLEDLNFLDVEFDMEIRKTEHPTANGYDQAEFLISTNPGQPLRALGEVASGGELSRIMLAIKTVLADSDDTPTLIFDEIDTGISGRTAQKVSEKLAIISKNHQVICITHLPQIAAMADYHYEITKRAKAGVTTTAIHRLNDNEIIAELARLLGGVEITEAVLQNAREMKQLAKK